MVVVVPVGAPVELPPEGNESVPRAMGNDDVPWTGDSEAAPVDTSSACVRDSSRARASSIGKRSWTVCWFWITSASLQEMVMVRGVVLDGEDDVEEKDGPVGFPPAFASGSEPGTRSGAGFDPPPAPRAVPVISV
ncbi:uncharacterized protein Z518_07519 [Rhinocladiella mackenziei CBS 650.93]|uniref:Uncharacterized protein n=1 Tax=Rhinocladiella mackenziei CBS 650.93 TaxID=1442369 RepID=A0A0D2IL85_9EURO|nr:uncharacterized protein Z518_07519 [Rhinocladiella mackenziei CBS 650.93]KIX03966.1 hypothetical protein Z518_07519 [Rhinocladiella mackenziei CBS 650.93]